MGGEDLAVAVSLVALYTVQCLSVNDLNILAAVFNQLADTYSTIALIRSFNQDNETEENQTEDTLSLEEVSSDS